MAKAELDRLLEKTVADALGVRLPAHQRTPASKSRHQAKAPRRQKHIVQDLHSV